MVSTFVCVVLELMNLTLEIDFAHAVIVEDLDNRQTFASQYIQQHTSGIETLDRNIVGRLCKWEGLEAFHGVVNEIKTMLLCGLLHTVRDLEVMLSWSGKVSWFLLSRYHIQLIGLSHTPNLPGCCENI